MCVLFTSSGLERPSRPSSLPNRPANVNPNRPFGSRDSFLTVQFYLFRDLSRPTHSQAKQAKSAWEGREGGILCEFDADFASFEGLNNSGGRWPSIRPFGPRITTSERRVVRRERLAPFRAHFALSSDVNDARYERVTLLHSSQSRMKGSHLRP